MNNINVEQAEQDSDVVLGNLLVNSIPSKVLFDTGASLSFVSDSFAQSNDFSMETMPKSLMIQTPRAYMLSTIVSHGNQIQVGNQLFLASLKLLQNSGIEVILGMDCLLYTSPSPRDVEESRMPSSA